MSVSKPVNKTQDTSSTYNTSKNLNLSDTSGITVGETGGDLTIINTDQNAFDIVSEIARGAVDAGQTLAEEGFSTAEYFAKLFNDSSTYSQGAAYDFSSKFGDSAFSSVDRAVGAIQDSSSRALDAVYDTSANALNKVTSSNESALDLLSNTFKGAFQGVTDFVSNLQEKAQSQLGDTVTALNAIAVENNKSSDQRIAEISTNTTKYIVIALAVLVTGAVAYSAFAARK